MHAKTDISAGPRLLWTRKDGATSRLSLAETLERVLDIQAESAGRLAEARGEGIPATVAVMSFEMPTPEQKQSALKPKP